MYLLVLREREREDKRKYAHREMEDKKTYASPESYAMNGGKGPYSYAQNSIYQVFFNIQAYILIYFLVWIWILPYKFFLFGIFGFYHRLPSNS